MAVVDLFDWVRRWERSINERHFGEWYRGENILFECFTFPTPSEICICINVLHGLLFLITANTDLNKFTIIILLGWVTLILYYCLRDTITTCSVLVLRSVINWKSNLSKLFIQLDCHIISQALSVSRSLYPATHPPRCINIIICEFILLTLSVFAIVIWYPYYVQRKECHIMSPVDGATTTIHLEDSILAPGCLPYLVYFVCRLFMEYTHRMNSVSLISHQRRRRQLGLSLQCNTCKHPDYCDRCVSLHNIINMTSINGIS